MYIRTCVCVCNCGCDNKRVYTRYLWASIYMRTQKKNDEEKIHSKWSAFFFYRCVCHAHQWFCLSIVCLFVSLFAISRIHYIFVILATVTADFAISWLVVVCCLHNCESIHFRMYHVIRRDTDFYENKPSYRRTACMHLTHGTTYTQTHNIAKLSFLHTFLDSFIIIFFLFFILWRSL